MWKNLIQDLIDSGKTQAEIAAKCGLTQPRVSQLLKGDGQPLADAGDAIKRLHRSVMRERRRAQAA